MLLLTRLQRLISLPLSLRFCRRQACGVEPASAWVFVCKPSVSMISGMLRPATPWKRSRTCENISQAAAPAMTVVPDTAAKAGRKSLALMPSLRADVGGLFPQFLSAAWLALF